MRSHQDCINFVDVDYNIGNEITNHIELTNFNSVSSISLNDMHLVCLGVMKKLIMLGINKSPTNVRIIFEKINELSASLLHFNENITSGYVRKCRFIQELSQWKHF
jgi:hypothetical protein